MPIQLDSYSSQVQSAAANPFQQRQDLVRDAARQDNGGDQTSTKPASTAAAQSQQSDSRGTSSQSQSSTQSQSSNRGSVVNISV